MAKGTIRQPDHLGMQPEPNFLSNLKILIADDHVLFRHGLTQLVRAIDQSVEVTEANSSADISDQLTRDSEIDLIILDLMMPGVDGLSELERLRAEWPEIPVIVISAKEDIRTIREALSKGAIGFIPKSSAANVTSGAIMLVLSGGIYVPPTLLDQAAPGALGKPEPAKASAGYTDYGLTSRQVEVLKLVSQGKSNDHIADQLGLTTSTVKMHISRIFKVLNVGNRTEAAARFGEIEKQLSV